MKLEQGSASEYEQLVLLQITHINLSCAEEIEEGERPTRFLNSDLTQLKPRQYSTPLRQALLLWQAWQYCTTCTASVGLSVCATLLSSAEFICGLQQGAGWLTGSTEADIVFLNYNTTASH